MTFALIAFAAIYAGNGEANAAIGPTSQLAAVSDHVYSDARAAASEARAKSPCKRPKAGVHYSCHICHQHLLIRPIGRTRSFLPAQKLKFAVVDTIADRLALAAAQASARLILASGSFLQSESASSEVIARTARLRN